MQSFNSANIEMLSDSCCTKESSDQYLWNIAGSLILISVFLGQLLHLGLQHWSPSEPFHERAETQIFTFCHVLGPDSQRLRE